jgi:hypothetical protein
MSEINFNIYVFTTRNVVKNGFPIIRVLHDEDDDWQFLSDEENLTEEDAVVLSLEEIIKLDKTILEIINLPKNRQALRNNKGKTWYIYDM